VIAATDLVLGPSVADWDVLEREIAVDPVTFEIIRHRLEAINEEQAIALKAVSASPIVTEAADFNNGLYTPTGEIISMGPQVVFHSGAMPVAIRHIIEDCTDNPGIGEGDMFAVSDPFKGAVHHLDVTLVAPIHHEGELVAWAGVCAHQVDMGGMTVGSISVKATEKQQEGLMLPPIRLVEGGVLREDIWRLILNASRQPEMVSLDMRGFIASNVIARRRTLELIEHYGIDTFKTVMSELIRYGERRFRERLLELPDGVYCAQGFLDHDGHENRIYRTDIVLTKDADTLRFDFSGSSPQAPGFINCTEAGLVGAVIGGMAPLLAGDIPWNHGILNAIEIVAPKGLICNAEPPAPTASATIAECWVIVNTIVQLLSKLLAMSDRHRRHSQGVTNGTFDALLLGDENQHGEPFGTQLMDADLGGGGASAIADGLDQAGNFPTPRPNIPNIETSEMHGPLLYLYRSFFADSGGDGLFRGGRAAGVAFTPYDVNRIRCVLTTQGVDAPVSPGVFGGFPGICNVHMVVRDSGVMQLLADGVLPLGLVSALRPFDVERLGGQAELLPGKTDEFELVPGDLFAYSFQGGGGYGDPLQRDVECVLQDVDHGVVTPERAEAVYGVIVGDGQVLHEASERLRAEQRRARIERSKPPVAGGGDAGERIVRLGTGLWVTRRFDVLQIECDCRYVFSAGDENWRAGAGRHVLRRDEIPSGIVVHADLQLAVYVCPSCGTLHSTDVEVRGAEPLHDIRLAPTAFAENGGEKS
jgi:N-methylhydantoinase B